MICKLLEQAKNSRRPAEHLAGPQLMKHQITLLLGLPQEPKLEVLITEPPVQTHTHTCSAHIHTCTYHVHVTLITVHTVTHILYMCMHTRTRPHTQNVYLQLKVMVSAASIISFKDCRLKEEGGPNTSPGGKFFTCEGNTLP